MVFREVVSLLNQNERYTLIKLQVLVIISGLMEVLTLVAMSIFMGVLTDKEELVNYVSAINSFVPVESETTILSALGICLILLLLLNSLVAIFSLKKLIAFGSETGMKLGDRLFSNYVKLDYGEFRALNTSLLNKKITTEAQRVTDGVFIPLMQISAKVILSLLLITSLMIYDFVITGVLALVFILFYFGIYRYKSHIIKSNSAAISKNIGYRYDLLSNIFDNIEIEKLKSSNSTVFRLFGKFGQEFAVRKTQNLVLGQAPKILIETLSLIILTSMCLWVLNSELESELVIEKLSVYALVLLKLLPALQQVYLKVTQVYGHIGSLDDIKVDLKQVIHEKRSVEKSLDVINLKDVNYKYFLNDVNLKIIKGKKYLIVGESGSGKSTLLNLLLGLLEPTSGHIYIDNKIAKASSYRGSFAYVPQNINVKNITVTDIISSYETPFKITKELETLAQILNLPPLLEILEQTVNSFSGGQLQRILFLRAFYHSKPFLFIDEGTSALDEENEKVLLKYLTQKVGVAVVMVSHNKNLIQYFDKVIQVEKGRVVINDA